jgi:hypothetical protein
MQRAHDRASASWGLGKDASPGINRGDLPVRRRDNEAGKWSKMEIEGGEDLSSRIHRTFCKNAEMQ